MVQPTNHQSVCRTGGGSTFVETNFCRAQCLKNIFSRQFNGISIHLKFYLRFYCKCATIPFTARPLILPCMLGTQCVCFTLCIMCIFHMLRCWKHISFPNPKWKHPRLGIRRWNWRYTMSWACVSQHTRPDTRAQWRSPCVSHHHIVVIEMVQSLSYQSVGVGGGGRILPYTIYTVLRNIHHYVSDTDTAYQYKWKHLLITRWTIVRIKTAQQYVSDRVASI